jgi:AcrR family transcriptional regulator
MGKRAGTRDRVLESARALFNRRGFDDVSIDEIMAHAGLTHGGFYRHFKTKSDLYAEVVAISYDFGRADCAANVVAAYLSDRHLENVERLCPLIAVPSDTARSGDAVKVAFERVFGAMVACFERDIRGDEAADRALAIAGLCVGSMVVSRGVRDPALAARLRAAAARWALRLGGWGPTDACTAAPKSRPRARKPGENRSAAGRVKKARAGRRDGVSSRSR